MKRDTIYVIFIVLIVGVFATNFIIYRMKSNALTIILTIITYIGSILLLVNHLQKKKINMKKVVQKFETNWLLVITFILVIFFIQDLVSLFHWVDFNNTTDKSLSYQLGVKSRLILSPILVLTVFYLIIFKFEAKQTISN